MFKEFEITVNMHNIPRNPVFIVNTNDLRAVRVKMTIHSWQVKTSYQLI